MPSIDLHLSLSLWWPIAYLSIGLLAGLVQWIHAGIQRGRLRPLHQVVFALTIWMIGWPVCAFLLVKDAVESRRAIASWHSREQD